VDFVVDFLIANPSKIKVLCKNVVDVVDFYLVFKTHYQAKVNNLYILYIYVIDNTHILGWIFKVFNIALPNPLHPLH